MSESIKENRIVPLIMCYPHERNYRNHPESQVKQLVASLERFGQGRSIVVQECANGSYTIVAGHGVVQAAQKLDWKELRADILPIDWTPAQVSGYLVADNLLSAQAVDDEETLVALLEEQVNAGYDLATLGSDEETLRQMLEALGDAPAGYGVANDESTDDLPQEVETRCKPGDIWQLGRHKIIIGDSFSFETIKTLMGDERADMLLCDPPYGMNFDPGMSALESRKGEWVSKPRYYDKVIGDDKDFDPRPFVEYFDYCKEQFWWGADYYIERVPARDKGAWFVWDKREGVEDMEFSTSAFELCWSRQKHSRQIVRQRWSGLLGTESQDVRARVHPTQKPLQVCNFFIEKYSEPGGLIVDLFLGSGTTLISAERLGRRCFGCEIKPEFADIILSRFTSQTGIEPELIKRWEAHTGQQATLLERAEEVTHA